jgi:hypothetical protein
MILDPVFTRAKGRRGEVKATKLNHTKEPQKCIWRAARATVALVI